MCIPTRHPTGCVALSRSVRSLTRPPSRGSRRRGTGPLGTPRSWCCSATTTTARTCCCCARADTLDSHAGQVAFPGGGVEAADGGPVDTALREAEEETGVDPAGVRPVAVLPQLYVPVSGFAVTPVLAHWQRPSPVRAVDPRETATVARVPVAELAEPSNRFQVYKRGSGWKGPAFEVDGLFVWGFTAGLLSVLLNLGGWERDWDTTDVRDLDVALAEHEARVRRAVFGRGE